LLPLSITNRANEQVGTPTRNTAPPEPVEGHHATRLSETVETTPNSRVTPTSPDHSPKFADHHPSRIFLSAITCAYPSPLFPTRWFPSPCSNPPSQLTSQLLGVIAPIASIHALASGTERRLSAGLAYPHVQWVESHPGGTTDDSQSKSTVHHARLSPKRPRVPPAKEVAYPRALPIAHSGARNTPALSTSKGNTQHTMSMSMAGSHENTRSVCAIMDHLRRPPPAYAGLLLFQSWRQPISSQRLPLSTPPRKVQILPCTTFIANSMSSSPSHYSVLIRVNSWLKSIRVHLRLFPFRIRALRAIRG